MRFCNVEPASNLRVTPMYLNLSRALWSLLDGIAGMEKCGLNKRIHTFGGGMKKAERRPHVVQTHVNKERWTSEYCVIFKTAGLARLS